MQKNKELKDLELTEENLNEVSGGAFFTICNENDHNSTELLHPPFYLTIKDPNDPILDKVSATTTVYYTDKELKFLKKRGYNPRPVKIGCGPCAYKFDCDCIWCLVKNGFKVKARKQ